jgi:hypothetical protein
MAEGRRKEDAHLREIEKQLRAFIKYYDLHTRKHDQYFAPGTVQLIDSARPLLAQLDDVRRESARKITPPTS